VQDAHNQDCKDHEKDDCAHKPNRYPNGGKRLVKPSIALDRRRGLCSRIYLSLFTHVLMASSTALDRSPFLPPNLSMVLSLSSFSSSSESSTLIRPISITNSFSHDSHVSYEFPISKLPDAGFCFYFCYHFPFTLICLSN